MVVPKIPIGSGVNSQENTASATHQNRAKRLAQVSSSHSTRQMLASTTSPVSKGDIDTT